jgi:type II secretory pathway pseudopilin PulG
MKQLAPARITQPIGPWASGPSSEEAGGTPALPGAASPAAFHISHFAFRISHSPKAAFTLIELLVAATVSMLLVGLLLVATRGIGTNSTRTQSNITRQGDAAFALDQIVQDLEGYVVPNFPLGEALQCTPETVGDATNAVWLTLLSTATDADNSSTNAALNFTGATRAISYRLARQDTMDAGASDSRQPYAIYRAISPARNTFTSVTASTTNMQAQYWPTSPTSPTAIGNFLTENVVAFSVRFLRADNGKWTSPGDAVRIGRDGATVNGTEVAGGFQCAEVSVTVLSPEGAQRVKDGVLTLGEAVIRHGRTSVRQTAFF